MPLSPGDRIPGAPVLDASGAPLDLASLAPGRPALLVFYKAECAASEVAAAVLPRFAAIPGVALAGVSQDDADSARAFAAAHGWTGRVALAVDPEPWRASDAFGVRATPTWVLVAADGRVAEVAEGWSRDAANALAAHAARLAGAAVPVVSAPDGPEPAFRPG
jgi:peroxiredoxin